MLLKNNLQGVPCYVSYVNNKRYENVQALTIISKTNLKNKVYNHRQFPIRSPTLYFNVNWIIRFIVFSIVHIFKDFLNQYFDNPYSVLTLHHV